MVDHRVFERISAKLPVRLTDLRNQKEEGVTCDISAQGLGIVCRKPLERGGILDLWLEMPDNKEPIHSRGVVAWAKREDIGRYRVGISLERPQLMGFSRLFPAL